MVKVLLLGLAKPQPQLTQRVRTNMSARLSPYLKVRAVSGGAPSLVPVVRYSVYAW